MRVTQTCSTLLTFFRRSKRFFCVYVVTHVPQGCRVALLDAAEQELIPETVQDGSEVCSFPLYSPPTHYQERWTLLGWRYLQRCHVCNKQVAFVVLLDVDSGLERERVARNAQGGFFRIYQPNKWRKRQQERAVQVPVTAV